MTGSHGFVGTNLIDVLSVEHDIIRWDVRNTETLPEVDAVIHLAGLVRDVKIPNTQSKEYLEYFEVNTELTKRIFDMFLESSAKKFIFFSSIKAKDGDTPYARSKKAAEDYIMDKVHDSRFMDQGSKKVYILRPCMIHGKGVKGNVALLFKYVKAGFPWLLASFENQRSYASMGNVMFVVKELLKQNVSSGKYNICDDETISTNELIMLINECLGKKARMLRLPKLLVKFAAKMGDILHLPLNTTRLKKLTEDYTVDNSAIKEVLEINEMPISALEGMKSTILEMG